MKFSLIGIGLVVFLAACDRTNAPAKVRLSVAPASIVSVPTEPVRIETELTREVETKLSDIRAVLDRDSLNGLVRLAAREPSFVSNFADEPHKVHWDLLRRTGFDPLHRLGDLLDGPHGTRKVGDQTWYIWPDFAARDAAELRQERLSVEERNRLADLIGAPGLARIRDGEDYPGIRTAIAEDGRWLYFVHETTKDTEARNEW